MNLEVGSNIYSGFTEVHVRASMDTIFDTFLFVGSSNRGFQIGNDCRVIDPNGDKMLDGFINGIDLEIGKPIRIHGSDKTSDLVDCTVAGTGEIKGLTVKGIIETICSPFGIEVAGDAGATIDVFRYNLNEKAIDVIRSLLNRYALLGNSDGNGNIVIESIASRRATLQLAEGNNIISGAVALREGRFSTLTANGQNVTSNPVSEANGNASRYRPNVVTGSGNQLSGQVKNVAEWMVNLSQPEAYTVSVSGIYDVRPNTLISIESSTLGVSGDLLVRSTTWSMGKKGHTTTFDLVNPLMFGGDATLNDWVKP